MGGKTKSIPIRNLIIILFSIMMLLSIFSIGYLVYSRWLLSARETTERIALDINNSIYNRVTTFIQAPLYNNEINGKIIENEILDLNDQIKRERFFVDALSSMIDEIYSFSIGTGSGEYYGARRNEDGVLEIMRNNASTGGNSWYYSVNDDLTAGELVVQAGLFDPRTRAWYQAAVETGGACFSPVYKHFVMNDLTVSAAQPVYSSDGEIIGVIGSHMLLGGIDNYLKNEVEDHNGFAVIIERESKSLIANSLGSENFEVLQDGVLKRYTIEELANSDILDAYKNYTVNNDQNYLLEGVKENYYVNVQNIVFNGIDWILISAVPENLLIADMMNNMRWSALLALFALALSLLIYYIFIGRLLKPMSNLLHVAESLAEGDLAKRAEIVRNDEIGVISASLNKVADKAQALVDNLEANIEQRTEELSRSNASLEVNREHLRLILDSAAEGIYGIDIYGKCTFCNASCIKMLGYKSEDEILGKDVHLLIHHTRPDGNVFPVEECKIFQSIKLGYGLEADDEVFWRADGTPFEVQYRAYPQIKNGKVVGGVVSFMDITERKQREAEIEYLSTHDVLTGLFNRSYFEKKRIQIDIPENLPLSVIFADINGLKLTNDIFGHAAGDRLIKKAAETIVKICRSKDVIARFGGDEFVILMPETNEENAKNILARIKESFSDARVEAVKCSISLGSYTKTKVSQPLEEIMANAENAMYRDKTINRSSINKEIIDTIVDTLHKKSPIEKQHSIAVSRISREIGRHIGLSEPELIQLENTGYLHDIGKITLDASLLNKKPLKEMEMENIRQHSIIGYRILNLFDETLDLAELVYNHHERWDGKGYPRGLSGEQIPLISRIISIAETYDRVAGNESLIIADKLDKKKREAVEVIKKGAGAQFDPYLAEVFVKMLEDEMDKENHGEGNKIS